MSNSNKYDDKIKIKLKKIYKKKKEKEMKEKREEVISFAKELIGTDDGKNYIKNVRETIAKISDDDTKLKELFNTVEKNIDKLASPDDLEEVDINTAILNFSKNYNELEQGVSEKKKELNKELEKENKKLEAIKSYYENPKIDLQNN